MVPKKCEKSTNKNQIILEEGSLKSLLKISIKAKIQAKLKSTAKMISKNTKIEPINIISNIF